MNWLAHLRLSAPVPLLRLGNLAGDFVRGVDLTTLHPELQRGIGQHRSVDRFVDAHASVRTARARLLPRFQRFSGVLVDVFFDHFLARDWHRHGDGRSLAVFVGDVHRQLREHRALLPPALQEVLPRFEQHGWMVGYAEVHGIDTVLQAMGRRVRRPTPIGEGVLELRRCYDELQRDFEHLWPQLSAFADHLVA